MMRVEEVRTRDALRELTFPEASLLIIDDSPAMVMFLQGLLERAGYARVQDGSLEITLADGGDRVGLFAAMPGEERCRAVFRRVDDAP